MTSAAATVALAVAGVLVAVPAGVAHADPPGPTDYTTVIVGITPEAPAIAARAIGGDAFIELTVERGTEVTVLGYEGEEYLRFRSDGTVMENRATATYAQNRDRYGASAPSPDGAAADRWVVVSTDGRYSWHDHRAHWMSRQDPPGRSRGERIQDGAIPLVVNGGAATIDVAVYWEEEPSRVPGAAGAIVGAFAVLIALSQRRRVAWVLALAGGAAAGIGWWQLVSVPPETGPSSLWWLLPAIAAVSAVVALTLGASSVSHALVVLGGAELALWALLRRDVLVKAILPTDAPFWLDRGVAAAAAVAGVVAIAAGGFGLFRLPATQP